MRLSIYIADDIGERIKTDANERGLKWSQYIMEMVNSYYSGQSSITPQEYEHEKDVLNFQLEQKDLEMERLQKDYNVQLDQRGFEIARLHQGYKHELEQKDLEIVRLHQNHKHEKELLTLQLQQLQKELAIQLEQKDREIIRLQNDIEWLRGMYSVAVTKALPEPKKSIWDKILRRKTAKAD